MVLINRMPEIFFSMMMILLIIITTRNNDELTFFEVKKLRNNLVLSLASDNDVTDQFAPNGFISTPSLV